MRKFFLICIGLLTGYFGFSQTIFQQNFESAWTIPSTLSPAWGGTTGVTSWHMNSYTTGWPYTTGGAYTPTGANSTTQSARFNTYGMAAGLTSDLITPTINLSAYTAGSVYLKFYHINPSGADVINVYVSNDNGSTWSSALAPSPIGASSAWALASVQLPGNSATTMIKFTGTSDFGNDDQGIDEVRVCIPYTPSAPPITFNPTLVTATSMTIGWTDNSTDEIGFRVYRSTNPTSGFVQIGSDIPSTTVAGTGTAYSQAEAGLVPGQTYYFRIVAFADYETTPLTGTQATVAGLNITSIANGAWSSTSTWSSGTVPTSADNVTITNGTTVNVDIAGAVCYQLTINSGGVLSCTGTAGVLTITSDLTNSGSLTFYPSSSVHAGLVFNGVNNNSFSGTGATTDLNTLTINKGTSNAAVLEMNLSHFSVRGLSTASVGFLTLTNGTLKVSGTNTFTGAVFSSVAYAIGATTGFWLNNPNFTVTAQAGSTGTMSGLLRITSGTFNIGTLINHNMALATGSTFIMEGGAMNVTGRFGVSAAANTITFNMSGGTMTVCTVGYSTSTGSLYSFDLGTSETGSINWTGGTVVLQKNNTESTHRDYRCDALVGNISGGTLQIGNSASGAAGTFNIFSNVPNLVINPTYANSVTFTLNTSTGQFYDNAYNITIGAGTTLNIGPNTFLFQGTTFTNNGTMVATGASTSLYFTNSVAQTFTGTGVATSPVTDISIDNDVSVTFSNTTSMPCTRINLFTGSVFGSSKLTLGNGSSTANIIQIGNGTTPSLNTGTFDGPLTFNLGTGGESIYYGRTLAPRSTGGEVNTATGRPLVALTFNDTILTNSLTIAGGNISTTTLNLTNGIINTNSANILGVSGGTTASIVGGSASPYPTYVNGPLAITLPASLVTGSTYLFPIGKSAYKPLELVNPTTTSGGTVIVKSEVFDANCGGTPGTGIGTLNTNRYWNASILLGAANFTNTTVRLTEAGLLGNNVIGQSATINGTYALVSTTAPTSTTIISNAVTSLGYFAIGTSAVVVTGTLQGTVRDASSNPISGATVAYSTYTTTTASDGTYQFLNVYNGPYTVTCSDNGYITQTAGVTVNAGLTTTQNFTLAYQLDAPVDVQGIVQSSTTAHITWFDPEHATEQYMHWDSGVNADALGSSTAVIAFTPCVRFTTTDLTPFNGMYLTKVRFYIQDAPASGSVTIEVYRGSNPPTTAVYSQAVPTVTANAWNEVILTSSVLIDASQELWFGYDVTSSAAATYPAGMDAGPAATLRNYFLDSGTWYEMVDQGFDNNWNIQGWASYTATGPILMPLTNNSTVGQQKSEQSTLQIPQNKKLGTRYMTQSLSRKHADSAPFNHSLLAAINSGVKNLTPLTPWTVLGYNVYRNSNPTPINGSTLVTNLYYNDGPLSPGTYTYYVTAKYAQGESAQSGPATVVISAPPIITLNLTAYLEGLYNGAGTMRAAADENGPHWGAAIADHITVNLNDGTTGALVYSATGVELSTSGLASVSVPSAHNGNYWITIIHRNSIETVSSAPVSFGTSTVTYAFDGPAKVAGGNLLPMEDGYYTIFAGDVDQNGSVDSGDYTGVDNDATNFTSGYLVTDVNGDGSVDTGDFTSIDNNNQAFVSSVIPY